MNVLGAEEILRLDAQHRAELAASWPPPDGHRVHRHVLRAARSALAAVHNPPATSGRAAERNGRDKARNRSN